MKRQLAPVIAMLSSIFIAAFQLLRVNLQHVCTGLGTKFVLCPESPKILFSLWF